MVDQEELWLIQASKYNIIPKVYTTSLTLSLLPFCKAFSIVSHPSSDCDKITNKYKIPTYSDALIFVKMVNPDGKFVLGNDFYVFDDVDCGKSLSRNPV